MLIFAIVFGILYICLFYINGIITGLLLAQYPSFKDTWKYKKRTIIIQGMLIILVLVYVVAWIII